VVELIAIKQQHYDKDEYTQAQHTFGSDGLALEAVLMHQLNRLKNKNIIRLRNFKNHTPERLWRFYFEYAPGGDLYVLKNNYRAWNTYLPEEFLWHVFHGLAHAALTLHTGPFRDYATDRMYAPGKICLVHFDLKPSNIFLGDADADDLHGFSNYPTIKMADFGLAKLTGRFDRKNPTRYRLLGTDGYRPPVRLPIDQAGFVMGEIRC
jgi:serine/threonine protein kinase